MRLAYLSVLLLMLPVTGATNDQTTNAAGAAEAQETIVPSTSCGPTWTPFPAPRGDLYAIKAFSESNAWAVGSADKGLFGIYHWDGTTWTLKSNLQAQAAIDGSPNDLWAVKSVIAHWDGTAWTEVDVPASGGTLLGILVVAANDVWAVGETAQTASLIEHWDGASWSAVPSPDVGTLHAITGAAANDLWAIASGPSALHWDGASWKTVADAFTSVSTLTAASATTSRNVWAAGFDGGQHLLTEHWNGTAWVPEPAPLLGSASLFLSVAAVSAADVWAAGSAYFGTSQDSSPLFEHWDGSAWSIVRAPHTPLMLVRSLDVAGGKLWAAGDHGVDGGPPYPPIYRLCPARVTDAGFELPVIAIAAGRTVAWKFAATNTTAHTVTDSTGLGLFDSGPRPANGSFTATFLGSGTYTVVDATSGASATVAASITISGGSPQHIRWAGATAPHGLLYDVEIQRPGGGFVPWQTGTRSAATDFTPDGGPGTYAFRARMRRPATTATSAWSPTAVLNF